MTIDGITESSEPSTHNHIDGETCPDCQDKQSVEVEAEEETEDSDDQTVPVYTPENSQ